MACFPTETEQVNRSGTSTTAISPIPAEVMTRAKSGMNYCSRTSLRGYVNTSFPKRISGYNSRMDNTHSVPGAQFMNTFVDQIGRTAAYAAVSDDADAKDEILSVLANMARQQALTGTVNCIGRDCPEWQRSDGRDLSDLKDYSFVESHVSNLQRVYLVSVADYKLEDRRSDHQVIKNWLQTFEKRRYPPHDVFFGLQMARYWPAIDSALLRGDTGKAAQLSSRMIRGVDRLVNADGSMAERTTRGDRALWYHNSAINETMYSMEIARAVGVRPPNGLEDRLHRAVRLFISAVQDHSVLDPWAKLANNARYRPGYQDWERDWPNKNWGGSWYHIYIHRYPDRAEARWLASRVGPNRLSAKTDVETGVGLGCIYRAAQ